MATSAPKGRDTTPCTYLGCTVTWAHHHDESIGTLVRTPSAGVDNEGACPICGCDYDRCDEHPTPRVDAEAGQLRAALEKAEAERDEWRTKALDVEKHPVVVALRSERDASREALRHYVEGIEMEEATATELAFNYWQAVAIGKMQAARLAKSMAALERLRHDAKEAGGDAVSKPWLLNRIDDDLAAIREVAP